MNLQDLTDRVEILDRINLYAELIDTGRQAEVPEAVFAEDMFEDHGEGIPPARSRDELRDFIVEATAPFDSTMHLNLNIRVDVKGDTATSRTCYLAIHWMRTEDGSRGRPSDFVSTGVYVDSWRRTSEGWRIAERWRENIGSSHLVVGERPEHLLAMAANRGTGPS